jgi:hypothetical protein
MTGKKQKSIFKEFGLAAVASVLLGYGLVYFMMTCGIYV